MPPVLFLVALAVVLAQLPACIGWRDPMLEQSKQAAGSAPSENGARNRAALQRLLQPPTPPPAQPAEPKETSPTSSLSTPRDPERPSIVIPSSIPTASSSRPTDAAGITLPFTPSPPSHDAGQIRSVPPYTIQMPAGSVYPNTLRCVPDYSGGSVCR